MRVPTLARRSPLIASLLCCLGIQAALSVLLLVLASLLEPARLRQAPVETIVTVKDRDFSPAYIAVSSHR